jgi:PPOX class probable F420-dependent enzyme
LSNEEEPVTAAKTIGGLVVRHPAALDAPILALLRAQNVCVINTLGAGDVIHSRAVWVDTDGDDVLVNSVDGRVWVRDLDRNPAVTCTVVNLANPYEFVSIEGRLVERINEGADDHIDALALKYLGLDRYPFHSANEPRVLFRIRPERILHMAPEDTSLR